MKNGWKYLDFEDCIESVTYTPKVLRKNFLEEGKFPIVSQEQDFINGYWNNPNDVFKIKKPVVIFGDHTQVVKYVDFDFVLGADGVKIFQPINELLPRYFYYFLNRVELKSLGYARHYRLLKQVTVPVPPIEEQRRIVAILDEAFACIDKAKANTEKNIQNARELFDSYLNNIFSNPAPDWATKTLKEVCAKITDGTHQTPTYFDQGYVFLSSRNVTSGRIDWDNVKYIDERQHMEMHKRVAPRVGDILLAKNGTTGVAALVDRDVVFDIYVSLAHIRVLDEVSPELMLYFINSGVAKKQFNKRLKGSGVPNLHLEEIREVVISYPRSKNEQEDIVRRLNIVISDTNDINKAFQKRSHDLDELKKSILQKAFSGNM